MRTPSIHPVRRARPRGGFTFVELSIGMVVTALVLGAMAAFSLATAQAWQNGASTTASGSKTVSSIPIMGTLACTRLDKEFGTSLCTGGYYPGTLTSSTGQQASILLWENDTNGATSSTIDASEVYLIEYDATDHVIYKWSSGASTPTPTYANFASASWIATFKYTGSKVPLVRNLDGMQIYVQTPTSATQLPIVEYRLYFSRGGHNQTRYGAVCVRNPTTPTGLVLN